MDLPFSAIKGLLLTGGMIVLQNVIIASFNLDLQDSTPKKFDIWDQNLL